MKTRRPRLSVITITLSIIICGTPILTQAAAQDKNSTDSTKPDLSWKFPGLSMNNRLSANNPGPRGAWLNLEATRQGDNFEWRWQRQSDDNVEAYIPQYSTDGIEFYDAGKITLFNENHAYDFVKTLSITGDLVFRIKQVNLDKTESFSPVCRTSDDAPLSLLTYPNPAITDINFQWPYTDATSVTFYVSNNLGKILQQQTRMITNPVKIDLNGLAPGIYYVFCTDNKGHRSQPQSFSKLPQ